MKHAWMTLVVGLILALGAGQIEAQQAPPAKKTPAKKRPRKAKKVWTNDDFPERPPPKAEKAEKKAKPVTEEEEEAKLKEALEELDAQAARAQSDVDWQQSRREELLAEIRALGKKREAAPTQREQLVIHTQVQEKRKQLLKLDDQLRMDQFKLGQIRNSKEEMLPREPEDFGIGMPPEEKAEQKKQGP